MAFDHTYKNWQKVLSSFVDTNGSVNYKGLKGNHGQLSAFLKEINSVDINLISKWTKNQQKAFWINSYNALTVELIVAHYPLKSIKDISKPWDRKVLTLGKDNYSLNDIEHKILRKKFSDPRIHAALVCASRGCPGLGRTAFLPQNLDKQLDQSFGSFINNPKKNRIKPENGTIYLSKIFKWYGKDFRAKGGFKKFIAGYAPQDMADSIKKAKVKFQGYDWLLNE